MMRGCRIVILGVSGMLGHKLFQLLRERFPGTVGVMRGDATAGPLALVGLLQHPEVRTGLDAMDFGAVRRLLEGLRPDVVVNAIGVVKQRAAAHEAIPSIAVNSLFPHQLAEVASGWGGRLVHFSTDCVFNGRRGAYSESDPPDAEDLYGRSKALGEVTAPNALTLRTSIIGRELTGHRSLLDWFLSRDGQRVRGFRRVVYSGVTTNELSKVVAWLIDEYPALSGLFQVVSEPITKFDLLSKLKDAYRLDVEVEPFDVEVSDRSMLGDNFQAATGYVAPPWPKMIADLARDETPYEAWGTSVLRRRH